MGTVPMGTAALRMIRSRVSWMLGPVDRSITASAPQRVAHCSFSTSSSTDEDSAELPMLALIFTRKLRPMAIGSSSGWRMLAGRIARPAATSSRTNAGARFSRKATKRISSVISPRRAQCIWEKFTSPWPARRAVQGARSLGRPWRGSWPCGPVVS